MHTQLLWVYTVMWPADPMFMGPSYFLWWKEFSGQILCYVGLHVCGLSTQRMALLRSCRQERQPPYLKSVSVPERAKLWPFQEKRGHSAVSWSPSILWVSLRSRIASVYQIRHLELAVVIFGMHHSAVVGEWLWQSLTASAGQVILSTWHIFWNRYLQMGLTWDTNNFPCCAHSFMSIHKSLRQLFLSLDFTIFFSQVLHPPARPHITVHESTLVQTIGHHPYTQLKWPGAHLRVPPIGEISVTTVFQGPPWVWLNVAAFPVQLVPTCWGDSCALPAWNFSSFFIGYMGAPSYSHRKSWCIWLQGGGVVAGASVMSDIEIWTICSYSFLGGGSVNRSVMSDSLWPPGLSPDRLLWP